MRPGAAWRRRQTTMSGPPTQTDRMWRFTVPAQGTFAFPGIWDHAETADEGRPSSTELDHLELIARMAPLISGISPTSSSGSHRQPVFSAREKEIARLTGFAADDLASVTTPALRSEIGPAGHFRPDFQKTGFRGSERPKCSTLPASISPFTAPATSTASPSRDSLANGP
jgi:hypothetical protein